MRVLVTGAHGFVGSHLVEALLDAGHRVRGLVSPWGALDRLRGSLVDIDLVRADITVPGALDEAFADVEVVFHAAGRVAEWGPWAPFHRANVLGTAHVLRAAERAGARRLVHISSVAVHRYRGFRDADPRTAPLDGDGNAYARTKVLAERLVRAADGIETVIVRPGVWLFGPRDPSLPRLLRAMRAGLFPLVRGGACVLNTVYVENLVQGLVLASTVAEAAGRVYLIADDGAPTWCELLGEFAHQAGMRPRWLSIPPGPAAALGAITEEVWRVVFPTRRPPVSRYLASLMRRDLHFSTRHARLELGFSPTLSWREGLTRTLAGWA